jgi:dihydrofolate reductase
VEAARPHEETFGPFLAGLGAMAMGATTYEWMLDHEQLLTQPEKWSGFFGEVPCWVFTHRPLPPVPGADVTFVEGDVRPVHEEMVRAAGAKNVWLVGGGELVGLFADHNLLDEIILDLAPVTLGAGAPLLPRRLLASWLELVDMSRNGQFARIVYRIRRAAGPHLTS